jgi:hypothetical protein
LCGHLTWFLRSSLDDAIALQMGGKIRQGEKREDLLLQ